MENQQNGANKRTVSLGVLVFIIESALLSVAILWMFIRRIPVVERIRFCPSSIIAGALLAGAILLSSGIFYLIDKFLFKSRLKNMLETGVYKIFEDSGFPEILLIAFMSGFCEEFFFRGVLLPEAGIIVSSMIFGLLHTAGKKTWFLGLWTAAIGGVFALSYKVTGNLAVPMTAHILNNLIAITYVRYIHLPALKKRKAEEAQISSDTEASLKNEASEIIRAGIDSRLNEAKEDIREIIEEAKDFVNELKEEFLPESPGSEKTDKRSEDEESCPCASSPVQLLDSSLVQDKVSAISIPEPQYESLALKDEKPDNSLPRLIKDTKALLDKKLKSPQKPQIPEGRKAPDTDADGIGVVEEPM